MPSQAAQQATTEWLGSGDKFPDTLENEAPLNEQIGQVLLTELPRKVAGSNPVLLDLQLVIPSVENIVRTVVPRGPKFCPLRWRRLLPPFFPALVAWSPLTLLSQTTANLSTNREIYLVRVDWEPIFSQINDQDFDVSASSQVRVGLAVRNGDEASEQVKERESFVGLTVNYGHTTHTFTALETEKPNIVPIHYVVPAKSKVYGYQRKYSFIYRLWFNVNTDGTAHNVGPDGRPEQGFIFTTIQTEEILVSSKELLDRVAGVRVRESSPAPGFGERMIDIKTMSGTMEGIIGNTKLSA